MEAKPTGSGHRIGSSPAPGAGITLAILCFVYVLNFLDRQLISILAKPIQDALHITDGQLGRLTGFYFALFYCFIAIPIGWLADRTSRVGVLSIACALWSGATAACGMVGSYGQLVVARMMVGVGEAGGVPPSYAIISDSFPRERRTTAMAIFNLGPPVGSALGIAFGASLAAAFDWRLPFYVIGAIGVVAALAVWLIVREPRRGQSDAPASAILSVREADGEGDHTKHGGGAYSAGAPLHRTSCGPPPHGFAAGRTGPAGLFATIAAFFGNPLLLMASLASSAGNFITYGLLNFTTLFLMREKGMTLEEVAIWYALVVAIGMGGGIYASGRIVDRFSRRDKSAYATIPALSLLIALPFFLAFAWAPTWPLALAFLCVPLFLNSFFLSATVTFVQGEVPPERRVISGALLLLVMNFIGLGFGPTYVGMASDFFRPSHGAHALQAAYYALAPAYLIGAALFLLLARMIRRTEGKM